MVRSESTLCELMPTGKLLEQEEADLTQGFVETLELRRQRASPQALKRKTEVSNPESLRMEEFDPKKHRMGFDFLLDCLQKPSDELINMRIERKVLPVVEYHSRCFRTYFAHEMKLLWPKCSRLLAKERERTTDGAWWKEPYHSKLLGHLESAGFRKEHWECTLDFWLDNLNEIQFIDSPSDERRSLNRLIGQHKDMINDEDTKRVLSPMQIEAFGKMVEVFEKNDSYFV